MDYLYLEVSVAQWEASIHVVKSTSHFPSFLCSAIPGIDPYLFVVFDYKLSQCVSACLSFNPCHG